MCYCGLKYYHTPLIGSIVAVRATSYKRRVLEFSMMATNSLKQTVRKTLECPLCLSFFKEPKIWTCSVTFSSGCHETLLESRRNKDVLLCPTCRGKTSLPGGDVGRLQSNLTVRSPVEVVELPASQVCSNSDSNQQDKPLQALSQLRQNESKWVLRMEEPLHVGNIMSGMAISPNNEMAVGCQKGGIFLFSSEGIIQDPVLTSVKVLALHFMPDGGFVIRDIANRILLYSKLCEKLDVTFETMADVGRLYGGLTVGKDGLIFVGFNECKKIQVFKPKGGKAIREITCNGFVPAQIFAMTSSQAIVFKNFGKELHVIDDVSGASIHSISKVDENPYSAVCEEDDSVIIAWVKNDPGLLSIVKYTKELTYIKNIITDFKIMTPNRAWCHLQEFKTGEIAFCTHDNLHIFHETWK